MPLSCPDLPPGDFKCLSFIQISESNHRVHVRFPPSVQISQNRTKILFFPRQETSVTLAARAEAAQPVNLAAAQTVGVDLAHYKVPLIILDQLHPSCHPRCLKGGG